MKLSMKAVRDGRDYYVQCEGMNEPTVRSLLADNGCTDIVLITDEEFLAHQPQI